MAKTIEDMTLDELRAHHEEIRAEGAAALAADNIEKARELGAQLTAVEERISGLKNAQAELDKTVTDLTSRFTKPAEDADAAADEGRDKGEAPEGQDPAAVEDPEPQAVAADGATQFFNITLPEQFGKDLVAGVQEAIKSLPVAEVEPAHEAAPTGNLVAAAAANSTHPAPLAYSATRQNTRAVILASADAPQSFRGSEVGIEELTSVGVEQFKKIGTWLPTGAQADYEAEAQRIWEAFDRDGMPAVQEWEREHPLPVFASPDVRSYGIGSIRKEVPADLRFDINNAQSASEAVDAALRDFKEARQRELSGAGALVAAGGWCAPSQVIMSLTENESTDGILQMPEIVAQTGGVNLTLGPDFSTAFASVVFSQTETQAIAGTTKASVQVSCPSFAETRLEVRGLNIVAPLLTRAAWPALLDRFQRGALVAFQHKINADQLSGVASLLSTAVAMPVGGTAPVKGLDSATSNILGTIEYQISKQREKYSLPLNQAFEVVIPFWVKGVIRQEFVMRQGMDLDALAVTDAQIEAWIRARGGNVSWVYDWAKMGATTDGYADTVQIQIYPAGTFVRLTNSVINISAVYDQASLATNMYTALFMEEGFGLARVGYGGVLVTVPIPVTGLTAGGLVDSTAYPFARLNDSQT